MRTEDELDQASSSVVKSQADSTFGVRSLDSTFDSTVDSEDVVTSQEELDSSYAEEENAPLEPRIWEGASQSISTVSNNHSLYTESSSPSSPDQHPLSQSGTVRLSRPLTSLYVRSPTSGPASDSAPSSTPRSVSLRSLRLSDDDSSADDAASQAVMSGGEDDDEREEEQLEQSAPQLVMPSLIMPSRRPFTENGRNLGKLKILMAGPRGM